jgi:hypothetical protein
MPIQIIFFGLQSCKKAYLDIGNEFIMKQVRQMLPLHFKTVKFSSTFILCELLFFLGVITAVSSTRFPTGAEKI